MGAGLGMGMGMAMANQLSQGQNPQAATPPPPPVEHIWHLAIAGKTTGPYSKADLGKMAIQDEFDRETYVWTAGQDGWMIADDVNELAQLFTVMPPPPPPAS